MNPVRNPSVIYLLPISIKSRNRGAETLTIHVTGAPSRKTSDVTNGAHALLAKSALETRMLGAPYF